MPITFTRTQPPLQMGRQPLSRILFHPKLKSNNIGESSPAPPRPPSRGVCNPFRWSYCSLHIHSATQHYLFEATPVCSAEEFAGWVPTCSYLLYNKGTEVEYLKTPHVGLAEVAAASYPDIIVDYFIRQVPRWSSLRREVHLRLGMVESSLSPILLLSTSEMIDLARVRSPSPVGSPPLGGARSGGGAGESGQVWDRDAYWLSDLSGEDGTEVVGVKKLPPLEFLSNEFLHWYFYIDFNFDN